jgi:glycosyltransferase involved in cell wall biosynthesis
LPSSLHPQGPTGIIIPHYNNGATLGKVLDRLERFGLPCVVVDDGSSPEALAEAERVAARPWVRLVRRVTNGGKGAAVIDGFRAAMEQGWSHALQIDADDQHDTDDLPHLLEASRRNPDALVLAAPRFSADAPLGRRLGRQISRFWAWVETLSFSIEDPLCGYRVYPLEAVRALLATTKLGTRMDFDPEIAIRLFWAGTPVTNVPSKVLYPEGNLSSFRMFRDNVLITRMHTRLVFIMLGGLLFKRRGKRTA